MQREFSDLVKDVVKVQNGRRKKIKSVKILRSRLRAAMSQVADAETVK